jgi:hypothetical protein
MWATKTHENLSVNFPGIDRSDRHNSRRSWGEGADVIHDGSDSRVFDFDLHRGPDLWSCCVMNLRYVNPVSIFPLNDHFVWQFAYFS